MHQKLLNVVFLPIVWTSSLSWAFFYAFWLTIYDFALFKVLKVTPAACKLMGPIILEWRSVLLSLWVESHFENGWLLTKILLKTLISMIKLSINSEPFIFILYWRNELILVCFKYLRRKSKICQLVIFNQKVDDFW